MSSLSLLNARRANYEVFTPNVVLIVASFCSILSIKIPWSHSNSMSLRLLLGILAPGPPDQQNDTQSSEIEIIPQDKDVYSVIEISEIQNAAKFHIGMLSISLITGLALLGFTIWWMEKKPFLNYVISLLIALVCRTFFSTLFDGVILLGSGGVAGGNALLAFEQIFINLVLAFWLSLTIYLHARVQRNFKSEPTLNLYRYGVPGVAVFFAFIWIFLLQAEFPSEPWHYRLSPSTQWVVNSFNLLCILIQLALVGDIARIMMKTSLDNDSVSLFRKVAILMGVLVFIFWLQFGLFIGRLPERNSSSYTYFFYFVDGIECASVCLILYFFNNWVQLFLNSYSSLMAEQSVSTSSNRELLAGGDGRGIVTLDSVFMTNESGKLRKPEEVGDIVYSNVVDSQRWEKIVDLYKRLNKMPNQQGTVVDGDEFYECALQTDRKTSKRTQRSISDESRKRTSSEGRCVYKNDKICDQSQKKNAFYSSKYLILDAKCDVPKYLETRPSLSSMSGKDTPKEGRMSHDYSPDNNSVKTDELVRKWLSDNSKNMSNKDSLTQRTEEEPTFFNKKPSELEMPKHKPVPETAFIDLDTTQNIENRVSVTQKIISTIDSVLRFPLSGKDDRKNSTVTDVVSHKQEATGQDSTQMSETIKSQGEIEKEPTESLSESNNSMMDKIPCATPVPVSESPEIKKKPTESLNQSNNSLMDKTPYAVPVPVYESSGLRARPEMPPKEKSEKFGEETSISNTEIKEQKNYEPKQSDTEDSKAKSMYLSQYLTNSELQERRMSREKRESDQQGKASKSIFSFPQTISSMVGFFVKGRGSLFGLRTDPKLSNTENLTADIAPRSENEGLIQREALKTEMKDKIQFEEQMYTSTTVPSKPISEEKKEKTQFEEQMYTSTIVPPKPIGEEKNEKTQFEEKKYISTTVPSKPISEEEKDKTQFEEKMYTSTTVPPKPIGEEKNEKTQFEEQMYTSTTVPSKPISEEERFLMKKISISSGSEFSIERINEEQPPQKLGNSISEKLLISINNTLLFATEDSHTSSESTIESRKSSSLTSSDSYSIEQYYQELFNAKQKRAQKSTTNLKMK